MTSWGPEMVKIGFSDPNLVGLSISPVLFSNLHIVGVSLTRPLENVDFEQGSSGRQRPRSPQSLKPSFPSLTSSLPSWLVSQPETLRAETRILEIQDSEDVEVLRVPDFKTSWVVLLALLVMQL